jgi:hypothetical protein
MADIEPVMANIEFRMANIRSLMANIESRMANITSLYGENDCAMVKIVWVFVNVWRELHSKSNVT